MACGQKVDMEDFSVLGRRMDSKAHHENYSLKTVHLMQLHMYSCIFMSMY